MALVLREHGIPSRLVTGFAGGERGPFGSYYLVRGRDAHAWVEAWCGPGYGWVAFDPTPPAGRPGVTRVNLLRSAGQLFENLEFLYGRYVLGFAQADQASIAQTVRDGREAASEIGGRRSGRLRAFAGGLLATRSPSSSSAVAAVAAAVLLLRRLARAAAASGRGGSRPPRRPTGSSSGSCADRGADLTPASAPSETLASADRARARAASPGRSSGRTSRSRSGGGQRRRTTRPRLEGLLKELRSVDPSR